MKAALLTEYGHFADRRIKNVEGHATVDMWPDTTAYPPNLLYPTDFKLPSGQTAMVYSAWDPGTVDLHFQWMQQYGIDGVVLEEFVQNYLNSPVTLQEEIDQVAQDRYSHGVGTVTEVAQARQGTAQAKLALVEATGRAQDAYAALLTAVGVSPTLKIKVADVSGRKLSPAFGCARRRHDCGGASAPARHAERPAAACTASAFFNDWVADARRVFAAEFA